MTGRDHGSGRTARRSRRDGLSTVLPAMSEVSTLFCPLSFFPSLKDVPVNLLSPSPSAETRKRLLKRSPSLRSFVRPALVLYHEANPAADNIGAITEDDLSSSPDFLLVFGTSLKIPGFRHLVKDVSKVVHENGGLCVFVNADEVSSEWDDVFDYHCECCKKALFVLRPLLILRSLSTVLCKTDDFVERIEADWRDACPGQFAGDRSPSPSFSPNSSHPPRSPPASPQSTPSPRKKRRTTSSAAGKRKRLDVVKIESTQDEMDEGFLVEDSDPERSDLGPLDAALPERSRAERREERRLRRERRVKRRKRREDRLLAQEAKITT